MADPLVAAGVAVEVEVAAAAALKDGATPSARRYRLEVMAARFHQATLQQLGVQHEPDPAAMRALQARAAALGVRLPASLVELYGMRDGARQLHWIMRQDDPVPVDRLGDAIAWRWVEERDCVREGLLPFLIENQAVCVWAVRLDGGDDPPVLVARDPDLAWRPCSPSFSEFVGCRAWDQGAIWDAGEPGGPRILLQAQDRPLRPEDLGLLRQRFEERPATQGWPTDHQHRFQRDGARVLVWAGEDQADWFISETSEPRLEAVLDELWACGNLRASLWSNDERGEVLLARRRG